MPQELTHIQLFLTAFGLVLILTAITGVFGLKLLRKLQVGQTVREDGPHTHFIKSGTPTFGGLFFLLPLTLVMLLLAFRYEDMRQLVSLLLLTLSFALTGFLDDLIKTRINRKGLSVRQKSLLLFLLAFAFGFYYLYLAPQPAFIRIPVSGQQIDLQGWIRLPYLVFVMLYLFFMSNSVNLTDGVDGLASSVTLLNALALALIGRSLLSAIPAALPAYAFSLAIAAGCLGFLIFNRHPARVFMGDTGSQALGAAVAGTALILGMPWLMLLTGMIYIIESFSVIIQVAYFKKTGGRRIFRMSPIHHHFELGGWKENKIVLIFSLVTLAGCLAAWLLI